MQRTIALCSGTGVSLLSTQGARNEYIWPSNNGITALACNAASRYGAPRVSDAVRCCGRAGVVAAAVPHVDARPSRWCVLLVLVLTNGIRHLVVAGKGVPTPIITVLDIDRKEEVATLTGGAQLQYDVVAMSR